MPAGARRHSVAAVKRVPTYCRICESACGLVALVEGERVEGLEPDPEHPLSRGFACTKGTHFAAVHHHPRRLLFPQVRRGGELVRASWAEANDVVGTKLRALLQEHGPDAVGLFLGNATVNGLGAVLGGEGLRRALRTTKLYSSLTLDNSGMFVVTEACLGNPMLTFVADYAGSDLVVLFGTDPLSSQPSQNQSNPTGIGEIYERARAGALVVVDPRTSNTARKASLHLRPRPGADAVVLAWLVREALATQRYRGDMLLHPADVEELRRAVAPFDRARAANAADIDEHDLAGLLERLLGAERPLVWSGLGVLLGPDGTLGYWLTLALQAALGGLDRRGGWLLQRGAIDLPKIARRIGLRGRDKAVRSRIGGFPAVLGSLASATLADDVLVDDPRRLRALIVIGGNPALSLPDAGRAHAALRKLDLLVSIDLFVNDTATLAHVVLPATDWLERGDVAIHLTSTRRIPHLQTAPAVVKPLGEARDDWDILVDIARAAGKPVFGSRLADVLVRRGLSPTALARLAVTASSPLRWSVLVHAARGLVIERDLVGALRAKGTDHPDRRVRLAVPDFMAAIPSMGPVDGEGLRLVSSVRPIETMNSWMHDSPGGRLRAPIARVHPDELRALSLLHEHSEQRIRLTRPDGKSVDVAVVADAGVRRGVVVLPYGWGHLAGAIGSGDGDRGVNANVLIDTSRLDAFTGQPVSNGLVVVIGPPG